MNRPTTAMYLFVNGRPVRDRQLLGAVRRLSGYAAAWPASAGCAIYYGRARRCRCKCHPAKAEVRFKDAGHVRGLIVATLSSILREAAKTSTDEGTTNALRQFSTHTSNQQIQFRRCIPLSGTTAFSIKLSNTTISGKALIISR